MTPELWDSLVTGGKFCGLEVQYSVSEGGDYLVQLNQQQYEQFLSYRAGGQAPGDVFSVTVDPSKLELVPLEMRLDRGLIEDTVAEQAC